MHPTHLDIQAKSVIAHSTFPGRIFAEVSSFSQAKNLMTSIPELNSNAIKLLSPEQILLPLVVVNPFIVEPQTWVRIASTGKGWKKYQGDICLVVKVEIGLVLVVIPRIHWNPGVSHSKPLQWFCLQHEVKSTFRVNLISTCNNKGFFKFQGHFYSCKGFLVVQLSDVDLCQPQDDLPTKLELEKYPLLESNTFSLAACQISERALKLHDQVKVIVGEYWGLFGYVMHVDDLEVAVYLESQDQTETLPSN